MSSTQLAVNGAVAGEGGEAAVASRPASAAMPAEQPSMELVPAASAAAPAQGGGGGAVSAAATPPAAAQALREDDEAWPYVTKALMVAVMAAQQPPAAAAATLLAVFRPLVDGWAAARAEARSWKDRADALLAEHRQTKSALTRTNDALHADLQALRRRLHDAEAKAREFESRHSTLQASSSSLEKKLAEAEAAAIAAQQALSVEAQERRRELELLRKAADDAKLAHDRLRREADAKALAHNAEIEKLNNKVKESETNKFKMEERLLSILSKNSTLEGQIRQKSQEFSDLQTRFNELNSQKEALQRQLTFYQRVPTRRFM